MPYAFTTIDPSVIGQVNRWDVPLNRWMGVKFDQGAHDTAFDAIYRATEDSILNDGNTMTPEAANKSFGIPGYLDFKDPVNVQRASLIRDRKDAELRRLSYLNAATHSGWSGKALLGTIAGMAGGVSNPLDFSLMFMPFVGSEAKAAGVAKMGASRFTQALERGFITEESLGQFTRFPSFGASVINGTFGNAITEIPNFVQNVRDQAIYGPEDAITNIALGGVTAGIFHVGSAAIRKLLGRAAETHSRSNPETQDAAARAAINDSLQGSGISADKMVNADREVIKSQLAFNDAAARLDAEKLVASEFKTSTADELVSEAANAKDLSESESSIVKHLLARYESGERGPNLFENLAAILNRGYDAEASLKQLRTELFRTVDAITKAEPLAESTSAPVRETAARNIKTLEARRNTIAEGIQATERRIADNEPRVEAIRQQRIQAIVDRERAVHEASLGGRVETEYRQQLKQQIDAGKILTDAQVKELTKDPTDEASMSLVKQQVANLDSELKPKTEAAETPSDAVVRSLYEKETELLDAEEKRVKARDKAYDVASDCLLKNIKP